MIVDSIARLMAPILSFTAEEIWQFMPDSTQKESSIHLNSLPVVKTAWLDAQLAEKWDRILDLRGEVTKALEEARAKKLIGHSLDAAVTIYPNQALHDALYPYLDDLRSVLIVSSASLVQAEQPAGAFKSSDVDGLSILVELAAAEKCERCWIHDPSVGTSTEHTSICSRCEDALQKI
jgi:isoleucyl-tRNA synthetase